MAKRKTEKLEKVKRTDKPAARKVVSGYGQLGTKYKKNPKFRDKPRDKKVTMEGIDLIRQLNESVRAKDPVEQAMTEMGLEFTGDGMDDYDAEDMGSSEMPGESGENDEMVEFMRELCDTGECEDSTEAAGRACDQLGLEGEERETKIGELCSAYDAIYGEGGEDMGDEFSSADEFADEPEFEDEPPLN